MLFLEQHLFFIPCSIVILLIENRTILMPKNKNLSSILIIGSGPIVIGQACEFDYSGTQALRSLT